jgi:hypothetical protein
MATSLPFSTESGYAGRVVTKPPNWHALVAWDTFFNSMGSGLFLVTALGDLTAPALFAPILKAAYPIAFVLLLADLTCLVLDLGDPLRFHHMLRVLKPVSPMSVGTWCLTAFSLPAAVVAILALFSNPEGSLEWLRKVFVIIGLFPALGVAMYKGVLFSTTAQPGWRDCRWLGGYIALSAVVLGCAELLLLSLAMGQEPAIARVRWVLVFLLVLSLFPLARLFAELYPTFQRVRTHNQTARFTILSVGVGILIPLVLLAFRGHPWLLAGGAVLILLDGLLFRFMLVRLPHQVASSLGRAP